VTGDDQFVNGEIARQPARDVDQPPDASAADEFFDNGDEKLVLPSVGGDLQHFGKQLAIFSRKDGERPF